MHPLYDALEAAADGRFPAIDGRVEVLPLDAYGAGAVVELTGHAYVLTDRDRDEVVRRGADGFGGAAHPDVLRWLAGPGGEIGSHDAVLVARGSDVERTTLAARRDLDGHPRVVRARAHRRDVTVHGDEAGFVTLGRGLVDRLEMSVELVSEPSPDPRPRLDEHRAGLRHGAGHGRRLIRAGLDLVPHGDLVWAQVAPGNAASLRAFLACGFVPIGAETLIG